MTEEDARQWLEARVPRETLSGLQRYAALLQTEAPKQNLVSAASLKQVWARHIVDSVQLLALASSGSWVDIGSGAGLPGLVVAIAGQRAVTLVEPRRLRAEFLRMAAEMTGVAPRVTVVPSRVEALCDGRLFGTISARAFLPLPDLLRSAYHLAAPETQWLLPKGRNAASEVEAARMSWHGRFTLVPSVTDSDASIVVTSELRPRKRR